MSVGSGSLFSILLLCRIMDIAYCVAIVLISSNVYLMFIFGILNITSMFFIEGGNLAPSSGRSHRNICHVFLLPMKLALDVKRAAVIIPAVGSVHPKVCIFTNCKRRDAQTLRAPHRRSRSNGPKHPRNDLPP